MQESIICEKFRKALLQNDHNLPERVQVFEEKERV